MAIGGITPTFSSVEIQNLETASFNCSSYANYPNMAVGPVGTYINDAVLVCGGREPFTNECYSLDTEVNTQYIAYQRLTLYKYCYCFSDKHLEC